jgi:hypothetical protein
LRRLVQGNEGEKEILMKRRIRIAGATAASLALATIAVMLAGAAIALGAPGDGGGCASGCSVGGHGTGGLNSDGAAQGFNDKNVTDPEHPGQVVSNSGTDFSGHLAAVDQATGDTIGSLSGAFVPGINDVAGRVTFGGTCNGLQSRC